MIEIGSEDPKSEYKTKNVGLVSIYPLEYNHNLFR